MNSKVEIIVIGGSAGSLPVVVSIMKALPGVFEIPIVVVLHRLKNVHSELDKMLSYHTAPKVVVEPDDKEHIERSAIYLAPQNYHLLVEANKTFSLDYSEQVHYSRPSIDVSLESIANIYNTGVLAILLSGANADGTAGLKKVIENGGQVIIQDPYTADYPYMPQNAIAKNIQVKVFTPDEITAYLQSLIL